MPYIIGGAITGTIIAYYYGFLFSIIVNSVAWFVISTVVNKYYWNYTGFKDEMFFVSKYITHRKKMDPKTPMTISKQKTTKVWQETAIPRRTLIPRILVMTKLIILEVPLTNKWMLQAALKLNLLM